jgi:hypothetical protein
VSQVIQHRLLYTVCFLGAVITSYSLSQLRHLVTMVIVGLLFGSVLAWRGARPQDFAIKNYLPRLFISVMWSFVFFASYLVVRKVQPTNYRAFDLAALGIWFALMACYFGLKAASKVAIQAK